MKGLGKSEPENRAALMDWGWDSQWEEHLSHLQSELGARLQPARVVACSKRSCWLVGLGEKRTKVPVAGRLFSPESESPDRPVVGDWVGVREGRKALVVAVLPRRSCLRRKKAGRTRSEQLMAANANRVLVVTDAGPDLNPRRLERYLAAVYASGAEPWIVVNKCDWLKTEEERSLPGEILKDFREPSFLLSAKTSEGVDELNQTLKEGDCVALVGSSGVGKSTLINRLLEADRQTTGSIRARDFRGQHTTSRRELLRHPDGFFLLDSPGLREFGLLEEMGGLSEAFSEIVELSHKCRFRNCGHRGEPGCAVRAALEHGELSEERLAHFLELQKEQKVGESQHKRQRWSSARKR